MSPAHITLCEGCLGIDNSDSGSDVLAKAKLK